MSFKEKNIVVTLVNFSLILIFYLCATAYMSVNDEFTSTNIFRVWGVVIGMAIFVTIAATIITHVVLSILEGIKTGEKNKPFMDDLEDERDKMIDLRGTKITYTVSSLGSGLAMLSFALGETPLVMFSLLIFFGVLSQIIGDITRLLIYRGVL